MITLWQLQNIRHIGRRLIIRGIGIRFVFTIGARAACRS